MWQSAVHLAGRIMPLQSDPKHDLLKQVKERDKTNHFFRQSKIQNLFHSPALHEHFTFSSPEESDPNFGPEESENPDRF